MAFLEILYCLLPKQREPNVNSLKIMNLMTRCFEILSVKKYSAIRAIKLCLLSDLDSRLPLLNALISIFHHLLKFILIEGFQANIAPILPTRISLLIAAEANIMSTWGKLIFIVCFLQLFVSLRQRKQSIVL